MTGRGQPSLPLSGGAAAATAMASVAATGVVRDDPRSPGGVELSVAGLELLGPSPDYPISPKEHGTTFLFEHRHLWLRSRRQAAVARVRARSSSGSGELVSACRSTTQ